MNLIKDQRGFTIIELITSFSLTMVVLVFLFNIVIIMKEAYITNSVKSDLIVSQSLLSTALNEDLYNSATSFKNASCASGYEKCYSIGFSDGTTETLSISSTSDKIKYGNVIYDGDDFSIGNVTVCRKSFSSTSRDTNSLIQIKIDIDSSVIEDYDFGINVIHLYSSSTFTSDISSC